MTLASLLYVSRSTIAPESAQAAVSEIVAASLVRNPLLGLTGALLFTGTHFAQVLEGGADSIDTLLDCLRVDPRHAALVVVDRSGIPARRFARWSMAYFGPSQFVSRHVTRLLSDPSPSEQRRGAEWLTALMAEFATT
jgi:hypothetical protein